MLFISFLFGFIFISSSSYLFFNRFGYIEFLVALFIISTPIPILAYTHVSLIKIYFYATFLLVSIFSISKILSSRERFKTLYQITSNSLLHYLKNLDIKILAISIIISCLYLYNMNPLIWRFESHDLLYFSWLNGIFDIAYEGPIRIPTAYPSLFSANHLTAGSILSPFLLLIRPGNIYSTYIIKYTLVFASFLNFVTSFLVVINTQKSNKGFNLIISSTLLFLFFVFFKTDIYYSLAISNYLLIILILSLASLVMQIYLKEIQANSNINYTYYFVLASYLLYSLLISKASTFPIIALTILLYIFSSKYSNFIHIIRKISFKHISIITFLLVLSISSWLIPVSQHGSLALSSPFCFLTENPDELKTCLSSITLNPFSGWNHSYDPKISFFTNFTSANVISFYYIWFLSIIPTFALGFHLSRNSQSPAISNFARFTQYYAISTAIAVVFLRSSINLSGAHTSHAYFISPIFTITLGSFQIFNYLNKIRLLKLQSMFLLMIPIFIYINAQVKTINSQRLSVMKDNQIHGRPSMTFHESKFFDKNYCISEIGDTSLFSKYLSKNDCANSALFELHDALTGNISDSSLLYDRSIIRQWKLREDDSL